MKRSRAALWLACACVLVVIAGAGIVFLTRGRGSAGAAGAKYLSATAATSTMDAQRVASALRKLPDDPQALVASEAQAVSYTHLTLPTN